MQNNFVILPPCHATVILQYFCLSIPIWDSRPEILLTSKKISLLLSGGMA